MLRHLVEYESPDQFRAMNSGAPLPAPDGCAPVIEQLHYLFHGHAPSAPGVVLAGGVTAHGVAVSGAGASVGSALIRLCGETAEQLAMARPLPEADADLPRALDTSATAISWIAAQPLSGAASVAVPRDLCRAGLPDRAGQSEGLAAGPSPVAAIQHGLLECFERQTVRRWWAGAETARRVSDPAPVVVAALGAPRDRRTHLLALRSDTGVPVILAASFDRSGHGFCFGVAARADAGVAAGAALRELAQSEFGLDLIRHRQRTSGHDALGPHDQNDLALADQITEAALLGLCPGEIRLATIPACPDLIAAGIRMGVYVCQLGQICDGFHVVKTVHGRDDTHQYQPGLSARKALSGLALFV